MDFQVWDLPGQIDYLDPSFDADSIFGGVGAMIWVLDSQDNYMEAIGRLTETILHLQQSFTEIKYSVFIHKTDSLTDDFRADTVRDIIQRISDDLFDAGLENPPVSFYPTSIYDHSIFEAFSKVIQGLVPQLPTFEALLNTISGSCRFEKVYLFDVLSKIYIASDTTPVDMAAYELCSDFIDVIVDLSEVYGWDRERDEDRKTERERDIGRQSAESFVSSVRGYNLYLREINTYSYFSFPESFVDTWKLLTFWATPPTSYLAFIGISKESKFEQEKPLVDYNIQIFQDTLAKVFARGRGVM